MQQTLIQQLPTLEQVEILTYKLRYFHIPFSINKDKLEVEYHEIDKELVDKFVANAQNEKLQKVKTTRYKERFQRDYN